MMNRNDLLNELVAAMKLNHQIDNVLGLLFLHEDENTSNTLSVILLLRNVKKFFRTLGMNGSNKDELFYVRINGSLKEILDIKYTNYSLVYLKNDPSSRDKSMMFNNSVKMNLTSVWNLFEDLVITDPNEIMSIIVTKNKIFVNCKSEIGSLKLQRSLLLKYGADYELSEWSEKLTLLRNNSISSTGGFYSDDVKISLKL